MQKVHGHVLETRDACVGGAKEGGAEGKSAQDRLASERFLARSAPRVIDLSRARRRTHGTPRTSRTSRDAYAKRDNAKTSNSELDFPVGEPSVLLPQPSILLAEKPLCKNGRFCISGSIFWLRSTGSRFGLRMPDVLKMTRRSLA